MRERQLHWVKAERSSALNACVELARDRERIVLRNSRMIGTLLEFTQAEIGAFFDGVRKGEFDYLLDGQN